MGAEEQQGQKPIHTTNDEEVELGQSQSYTNTESTGLHRTETKQGLKSRHSQLIALGGTIGTGLFVGSGQALAIGGPLSLLLSYSFLAFLVFGIATATGEMSSYLPVPGCSVPYYASRFVSPSLGFAMGWMYWYTFATTVVAEISACALVVNFWSPPVGPAVWITISLIVIFALNCFPVNVYGETEFWFASLKVFTIIGLIILTIVLFFGGGPTGEPLYFHNWGRPSAMNEYVYTGAAGRFAALLATMPYSFYAFAFSPELLVTIAGEMKSPRRTMPIMIRRYFYRLVFFYVIGALCIGILISSRNTRLRSGGSGAGASPWAIGIKEAGIHSLDSVVNAAILTSAWSAGNSYFYLTTRILYSMAKAGNAPKLFARTSKSGIPYWATAATAAWLPLAYLNVSNAGLTVFTWFLTLGNMGGYESWVCCGFIYYCFRRAMNQQEVTDIPFRSRLQPYYIIFASAMFFILMLLNGVSVFYRGLWSTPSFIAAYVGLPIFIAIFLGHKFIVARNDPWIIKPQDVDLQTGLSRVLELEGPPPKADKWYMKFTRVLW